MTTIVNIRKEPYDFCICRPSNWDHMSRLPSPPQKGWAGNPYRIGRDGTREEVIQKYRDYFYSKIENNLRFKEAILGLKGLRLACFCKPLACHGDIIKEWLDDQRPS